MTCVSNIYELDGQDKSMGVIMTEDNNAQPKMIFTQQVPTCQVLQVCKLYALSLYGFLEPVIW